MTTDPDKECHSEFVAIADKAIENNHREYAVRDVLFASLLTAMKAGDGSATISWKWRNILGGTGVHQRTRLSLSVEPTGEFQ